jgi:serine/threonine-protein kinase
VTEFGDATVRESIRPRLGICPACQRKYGGSVRRCPIDGRKLLESSAADMPTQVPITPDAITVVEREVPPPGRLFGSRFLAQDQIGEGAMGVVFRGVDMVTGEPIAVKLARVGAGKTPELERLFRREARLVAMLDHPNTVRFIDWGVDPDGAMYLVTELLQGVPLDQLLESHAHGLGESRSLQIIDQIAASLEEAHGLGVIHRDLKPANIFVHEGRTKVLDFGIARLAAEQATHTMLAGCAPFTPMFASPEQIIGEVVDHRSDIYSLGVLAYTCLAGRPPHEGSIANVIEAHVSKPIRRISEKSPHAEVSMPVEMLVRKMLAKKPGDRPQSASLIRRSIARLRNEPAPTKLIFDRREEKVPTRITPTRVTHLTTAKG